MSGEFPAAETPWDFKRKKIILLLFYAVTAFTVSPEVLDGC